MTNHTYIDSLFNGRSAFSKKYRCLKQKADQLASHTGAQIKIVVFYPNHPKKPHWQQCQLNKEPGQEVALFWNSRLRFFFAHRFWSHNQNWRQRLVNIFWKPLQWSGYCDVIQQKDCRLPIDFDHVIKIKKISTFLLAFPDQVLYSIDIADNLIETNDPGDDIPATPSAFAPPETYSPSKSLNLPLVANLVPSAEIAVDAIEEPSTSDSASMLLIKNLPATKKKGKTAP